MEEEKWIKDEAKRKKEETKKWGVKISAPTLKTQPKAESTQKKKKIFFKIFKYLSNSKIQFKIFIPKFSIPHSQCPNFKLKSLVFKKSKP